MKKQLLQQLLSGKSILSRTLMVLTLLAMSVSGAWADEVTVPTPVYFEDFENVTVSGTTYSSTHGDMTQVGSGEITDDSDTHFGKIYHNDPNLSKAVRTNYLQLPSTCLSGSKTSNEITIGFWVNVKNAADFWWSPIFTAYASKCGDTGNSWPMFSCSARGWMQINCNGYCDFGDGLNDNGSNSIDTYWLDDAAWHYYTVTMTATNAKIYIDGVVKNSWTVDNSTLGQVITGLFTGPEQLPYICLGGNQAWTDSNIDPAFGFDDVAVYSSALSADQIKKIMANKGILYKKSTSGKGGYAWASSDITKTSGTVGSWYTSSNNVKIDATNGLYTDGATNSAVLTYSPTANSIQTIDCVFSNLPNTGQTGQYTYLKIGSGIEIQSDQQDQWGKVIINGVENMISNCNVNGYNRGNDLWTIHAEINTATNTVTALTILGDKKYKSGSTTDYRQASYTLSAATSLGSATYNTITLGVYHVKGTNQVALNSISITEEQQTVTTADYTINYNYTDGETTTKVKTTTGTSAIGETVNAESPITVDGQKYYIKDGETTSMTIEEGTNTLNVELRKANSYSWTAKSNVGNVDLGSGTYTEGDDDVSISFPRYVNVGGTLYVTKNSTDPNYGTSFTPDKDKYEYVVEYKATTITNVVYYSEGENITGATSTSSGSNMGIRSSNQKCGYAASDITIANLPAGTYTVNFVQYANSSAGSTLTYQVGNQDAFENTIDKTSSNWTEFTKDITVTENTDFKWLASGDSKNGLDYIYITGTPDKEIVGTLDYNTAYLTAHSDYITLKKGESYHYNFVNHNNGVANAQNWVLPIYNGETKVAVLRSDNWDDVAWSNDGFSSDFNWDTFLTEMNGATVDMYVTYTSEGAIKMTSTITTADGNTTRNYAYTKTGLSYDNITTALSVSLSWLQILEQYGSYNVTCNTPENGTVTAKVGEGEAATSLTNVKEGTTVTLAATPSDGYVFKSYTVTDASGNTVTVTDNTFTMPASSVTVTATFGQQSVSATKTFDFQAYAKAKCTTQGNTQGVTLSSTEPKKRYSNTYTYTVNDLTDFYFGGRIAFQTTDIVFRNYNNTDNGYGLQNLGSGGRQIAVLDLKAGDKITFTCSTSALTFGTTLSATYGDAATAVTSNGEVTSGIVYTIGTDGDLVVVLSKNTGMMLNKIVITSSVEASTVSKPNIVTNPADNAEAIPSVDFTVSTYATSDYDETYQWYCTTTKDDTSAKEADKVPDATSASLTTKQTTANTYYYYCVVTNVGGSKTTSAAKIVVAARTVETPTYTIGSYNFIEQGYPVTIACATEGATLQLKQGSGSYKTVTSTVYVAGGTKITAKATKTDWTDATASEIELNAAPSATSPDKIIPFVVTNDDYDKDVEHVYKAVTTQGNRVAGRTSATTLKYRINNNNKVSVTGVGDVNGIKFTVNSGYTVTNVAIKQIKSNRDGEITLNKVYVDGTELSGVDEFTIPKSSASDPAKDKSYDMTATSEIVFAMTPGTYDTSKQVDQVWAEIEVTYCKTSNTQEIAKGSGYTEPTDATAKASINKAMSSTNMKNVANDVASHATIPTDAKSSYVNVSLKASTVSSSKVTGMTFDVTPKYVASDGSVKDIANTAIESAISFRLPVDANVTQTYAIVKHTSNNVTTTMGSYQIKGDATNGKYIEVSTRSFSTFGYDLSDATYNSSAELTLAAKATTYYYATFSNANTVTFWPSAETTVYKVSVSGTAMTLTELDKSTRDINNVSTEGYYVPANTGVLLKKTTTGATYYTVSDQLVEALTDNMLYPGMGETTVAPGDGNYYFYKLAYNDYSAKTGLGFYWGAASGAAFTAKAGGAYLAVQQGQAAKLSGFSFDGNDSATAIKNVNANSYDNAPDGKYFQNGKLIIIKNGKQYNAAGRLVK